MSCSEFWVAMASNSSFVSVIVAAAAATSTGGKSRCVTKEAEQHLSQWRLFANHSFYFHDDAAVDALMNESWVDEEFRTGKYHPNETSYCSWEHGYPPNIPPREVYHKCATEGATKADLWRYALLWRYGGIYTDRQFTDGI